MNYPEKRDLDGVYFRVCRDSHWQSICFSDMTKEERSQIMAGRSEDWLQRMCEILASTIRQIGDELDLVRK
jgi:hypothetical protein